MLFFIFDYIKNMLVGYLKEPPGSSRAVQQSVSQVKRVEQKLVETKSIPTVTTQTTQPKFGFAVESRVTSNFGVRIDPVTKKGSQFHAGVDFGAWGQYGSVVKAPETGIITMNGPQGSSKICIVAIKGEFTGNYHYLCHVGSKDNKASPLVRIGQRVSVGQAVGYVNNSGRTTGAHVHHSLWTKTWKNVDVGLWYKKYAPELFNQMRNYTDRRQIHRSNTSGTPEADL